jgi:hypothetical protein
LEAIIVTCPFILFFIFFREKPGEFPSRAARLLDTKGTNKKEPYIKTIK